MAKSRKVRWYDEALALIHDQFGSRNAARVFLALLFVWCWHEFTVEIHTYMAAKHLEDWIAQQRVQGQVTPELVLRALPELGKTAWWMPALFPSLLLALFLFARLSLPKHHLDVTQRPSVPSRALLLFLSDPFQGSRGEKQPGLTDEECDAKLVEQWERRCESIAEAFPSLAGVKENWRMPLEAIAWHARALDVVVVASRRSRLYAASFVKLVKTYLATVGRSEEVEIFTTDNFPDWKDGVEFEDAKELSHLLDFLLDWIVAKKHVPLSQVMTDITGGQKVPAVVGAALSLPYRGHRIQYIFGSEQAGYQVREYDITFRPHIHMKYVGPA